ncbi:MAG: hypothetical protein AAB074_18995 [Planctomycetota bacterium]
MVRLTAVSFVLVLLVAFPGCRRRKSGDTFVSAGGVFTTDNFPGSAVQDGNVADDKRAFSPSGKGARELRCTFNGDHGTALATYESVDSAGDPAGIYAHYFDGETWTPPDSAFSERLSAPMVLSPDLDGNDAGFFLFQRGLGYRCGCQSDPDVVNLFFEVSDSTQDAVHHARLTADLDLPGVVPAAVVTPFETFLQDDLLALFGPNLGNNDFVAADAGDGGECVAFYRKHFDAAGVNDHRLFARRTGGGLAVEIGSGVPNRSVNTYGELSLAITPPGEEVGFFDPASTEDDPQRAHPASRVHVFFYEDAISEMDGLGDEMRTRAYVAGLSGGADGDAFVPNAGAAFQPPFEMGIGGTPPEIDQYYDLGGIAVAGDAVGVWFADSGHIYYQEYSPDPEPGLGWRNDGGFPNPILVDDDSEFEANKIKVFTRSCTCESLSQSTVFWNKVFAPDEGPEGRLQVRVREGE